MQRARIALLAFAVALATMLVGVVPASAGISARAATVDYYLSLGTSLAQGVQPIYAPGPGIPIPGTDIMLTQNGYADQLYTSLKAEHPTLQLIKLGCPGETSTTFISGGGPCQLVGAYPGGASQLQVAVAEIARIRAGGGRIAYLTLDIGSNDVPFTSGCIDAACVGPVLVTTKANLTTILTTLNRALAGGHTAKAGMTYYDPYLGLAAEGAAYAPLAAASLVLTNTVNQLLNNSFRSHGFRVADVAGAFKINTTSVRTGQQGLPTNVYYACKYAYYCDKLRNNVHPTTAGYTLIAQAFEPALNDCRRHGQHA